MKTRIVFLFMLMFLVTSFVNAKTNIQQILMSHPWYEEVPREGLKRPGWDEVPRIGLDFGKDSVRMYLFGRKDPDGMILSTTYPYYLCNTLPDYGAFDKHNVGKTTSGKYLIISMILSEGGGHPLRYELLDIDNQCIKIASHDAKIIINKTWRSK